MIGRGGGGGGRGRMLGPRIASAGEQVAVIRPDGGGGPLLSTQPIARRALVDFCLLPMKGYQVLALGVYASDGSDAGHLTLHRWPGTRRGRRQRRPSQARARSFRSLGRAPSLPLGTRPRRCPEGRPDITRPQTRSAAVRPRPIRAAPAGDRARRIEDRRGPIVQSRGRGLGRRQVARSPSPGSGGPRGTPRPWRWDQRASSPWPGPVARSRSGISRSPSPSCLLRAGTLHQMVHLLRFNPRDGSILAAAGSGGGIELWDLVTRMTVIAALPIQGEGVDGSEPSRPTARRLRPASRRASRSGRWSSRSRQARAPARRATCPRLPMAFGPGDLLGDRLPSDGEPSRGAAPALARALAVARPPIWTWDQVRPSSVGFDDQGRLHRPRIRRRAAGTSRPGAASPSRRSNCRPSNFRSTDGRPDGPRQGGPL